MKLATLYVVYKKLITSDCHKMLWLTSTPIWQSVNVKVSSKSIAGNLNWRREISCKTEVIMLFLDIGIEYFNVYLWIMVNMDHNIM